jgi:hypothetical protein
MMRFQGAQEKALQPVADRPSAGPKAVAHQRRRSRMVPMPVGIEPLKQEDSQ